LRNPGTRALCVREVQKSISQSVKKLIEDSIARLGVSKHFRILNTHIETPGGGRIDFIGLQSHTAETIKSFEGAVICWVEEAQTISQTSLNILRPTIRAPGSQLWFSYNPRYPDDPVDVLLRGEKPPKDLAILEVNWDANPFVSTALIEEMREDYDRDPGLADHVWGGQYLKRSEASVFKRWQVDDFEARDEWSTEVDKCSRVAGLDFGFSIDPTAAVLLYINPETRTIYIAHEGYEKRIETDHMPGFIERTIPGAKKLSFTADSARPETISYLNRHSIQTYPSKKGAGSVDEGVRFLQSYDIVVHPRCIWAQRELARYSYKVDKHTGEILSVLEDTNNHLIDAMRYALEKFIRRGVGGPGVRAL
jgi:phage terminase large subunit